MKFKVLLLAILFGNFTYAQNPFSKQLHKNWTFNCLTENPTKFQGKATVPGNIHMDLFDDELIPHPFEGTN